MTKHKKKKKKAKPISILVWADSPATSTGFATVIKNIFYPLAMTGRYDIDIIGVNDRGGFKDPNKHPYRIYPARVSIQTDGGDYYGRDRLIAGLLGKDADLVPPWDIVFTLNDPFILDQKMPIFNKGVLEVIKEIQATVVGKLPPSWCFKTVSYWPIDSALRGNWVKDVINLADYPVSYTKYGERMIDKSSHVLDKPDELMKRLKTIYHGVNSEHFYPLPSKEIKKFRAKYFEGKVKEETFLVSAIARNQMRKDLPRTMKIFKEFQRRRPNSYLYLHCQETDAWGSLREYARNWDLKLGEDWGVPAKFSSNIGYPLEFMNLLYNGSDAVISTSLGEGFGFYNLEGFATKCPVVAPNNTTHPELFGYHQNEDITDMDKLYEKGVRGIPILSGSTSSEWAVYGQEDFERLRPLTNVDDAVKKLLWLYDNPEKGKEIAERAYKWVEQFNWQHVVKQWDVLFQDVYNKLEVERSKIKYDPSKVKQQHEQIKEKKEKIKMGLAKA